MELINRIRKSRKGFTLVEIIVVLVILAILAAFTIPAMLGFVDDAKGKAYIAQAREVYVAAQATATEITAKDESITLSALGTALSSDAVQAGVSTATTSADIASYQMQKYLSKDMKISGAADAAAYATAYATTPSSGEVFWTVTVGTTGGTEADPTYADQGIVKNIVYINGNYKVTIADGNASVVKLP